MTDKTKVVVTPAGGDPVTHEVNPEPMSVKMALKAAGVSASKMNIAVDGTSARPDTFVPPGATVSLTEKAAGS